MNYFSRAMNKTETDLEMSRFGRMGVFRNEGGVDELLGSYVRNYSTNFDAFFPFRINGKHLALYSPDYTCTRIMELPSCKDLGGEEPDDQGFCPLEYFVPTYIDQKIVTTTNNESMPKSDIRMVRINNPSEQVLSESVRRHEYVNLNTGQKCEDIITCTPLTPATYYPFGFVSGCVWGDDSTNKIQYLDLTNADKGVLLREERFGYVELPENLRLENAIDMRDFGYDLEEEDSGYIRINILQTFDLESGRSIKR